MTMITTTTTTPRRSALLTRIYAMITVAIFTTIHNYYGNDNCQYNFVVHGQPTSSTIPPTTITNINPNINRNYDRFNYVATIQDDTHVDFGPEDWANVQCPDLATCVRFVLSTSVGLCRRFLLVQRGRERNHYDVSFSLVISLALSHVHNIHP